MKRPLSDINKIRRSLKSPASFLNLEKTISIEHTGRDSKFKINLKLVLEVYWVHFFLWDRRKVTCGSLETMYGIVRKLSNYYATTLTRAKHGVVKTNNTLIHELHFNNEVFRL